MQTHDARRGALGHLPGRRALAAPQEVAMGWLLFAPVLPLGRMRRLAFFASYLIITAVVAGVAPFTNNLLLVLAIFVWPQFCIHARRLHDIGGTALWMLLPWFVEGVCFVFGGLEIFAGVIAVGAHETASHNQAMAGMAQGGLYIGIFGLAVGVGFFLLLSLWPSSRKAKYGPPIGAAAAAT
jgi:uncharacterized membrane protein YhaH (DUF805 family)